MSVPRRNFSENFIEIEDFFIFGLSNLRFQNSRTVGSGIGQPKYYSNLMKFSQKLRIEKLSIKLS